MIEGSRHERAALVSTAYIIGFITAFIGFGVAGTSMVNNGTLSSVPTTQTASVAAVVNERGEETLLEPTQTNTVSYRLTEKGLYLLKGMEHRLISLNVPDANGEAGVHVAIAQAELSPNQEQLYFCEQYQLDAATCTPFVYTVAEDVVEYVKVGGERQVLPVDQQAVRWSDGELLTVGSTVVDPTVY